MANVFDYLSWRSDVPLSVDPFNEVDNLILSELAYAKFDGIVPEDGAPVPLQEVCSRYFRVHTKEEILADKAYTARAPLLMEEMLKGARFRDTCLARYLSETDRETEKQLAAVTFLLPDGSAAIAFRGTDGTLVGWKEDFNFSFQTETEGQSHAVSYLDAAGAAYPDRRLIVLGHSKGGNLAVFAAAFCAKNVQDRIEAVYTNDGPGLRHEIVELPGYGRILPRIVSIIPDTSIIGRILSSKTAPRVILSDASGLAQHDGFSWQVRKNRFVPAEFSKAGELIDKSLDTWLEQLDDPTRRTFFDTVYELFSATGANSLSELGGQKLKTGEAMLSSYRALPKERRQEIFSVVKVFAKSSGQTAADYLLSKLDKEKEV
ncbi:MAG: DUF2974 domain-containing protein [Lachnospiraceae bacterium]|nr:DUF2974 domain-containing protein [Lachnospiraceae bacterium]